MFYSENTPELRKKLEELGYKLSITSKDTNLGIATFLTDHPGYTTISKELFDTTNKRITWNCAGRIDCGINEELFLAIAALRGDSDKNQWFVSDTNEWYFSNTDYCGKYLGSVNRYRKATIKELVEHFK